MLTIPAGLGRRFVIPDIHGCYQTFEKLLDRVGLTHDDQLFLLGDYVSRGPSSAKVLDTIIKLKNQKYNVFALRGNHEQMILDCIRERPHELSWLAGKLNFQDLLAGKNRLKGAYLGLLKSLPYYIELEDWLLVHAGFDFSADAPYNDYHSMMWIESFDYNIDRAKGKRIIHGHKTQPLTLIKDLVSRKAPIIPLDNGCVYLGQKPQRGSLLCFELNNGELFIEQNTEGKLDSWPDKPIRIKKPRHFR